MTYFILEKHICSRYTKLKKSMKTRQKYKGINKKIIFSIFLHMHTLFHYSCFDVAIFSAAVKKNPIKTPKYVIAPRLLSIPMTVIVMTDDFQMYGLYVLWLVNLYTLMVL